MRLNKKTLHLTAFILACFASLPAHGSTVFEKAGDKQAAAAAEIQRNPEDGDGEGYSYIAKFEDAGLYQSFVETEVQLMNTVTSLSFMNAQVLKFPSEEDAEAWFATRKDVQIFVKDGRVRVMAEEIPYGIVMVEALGVDYVAGSGIKSCIIDTGYDLGHEDLPNGSHISGGGTCTDDPCNWKEDLNGHGTHVAGIMAALTNEQGVRGVVSSGYMPMHIERGINSSGSGFQSWILQSMKNCVEAGAKVVNISLGGPSTPIFDSYLDDLVNEGTEVLFVSSAGNSGDDSFSYPASADNRLMMSVASVTSSFTRSSFSQYNDQVDIAAPGSGVKSTIPSNNYGIKSGTSMSSPHVAAVAALIWSHHPGATAADVRRALEKSAIQPEPYTQGERNDYLGWGIVNAELALEFLVGKSPTTSPSPTSDFPTYSVTDHPTSPPDTSFPTSPPDTIFPTSPPPTRTPSDAPTSSPTHEPTSSPTHEPTVFVCSDDDTNKFFLKKNKDGIPMFKKCKNLRGKDETNRKRICEKKVKRGYLSAKNVCPKTCDICSCAAEIKHLENKLEHYKRIIELNNIEF